jgi:hypothetical protein
MSSIEMAALACVSSGVVERARRVNFAADLLKRNVSELEARRKVQAHFGVSRWTAYRTLDIARDLV